MEVLNPTPTEETTDSPSSLVAEPATSESQDQSLTNENAENDKKAEEERKIRRLERRKALALARSPQAPKLGGNSGNSTIDLTNEDDDPNNRWFKKTFNAEHIPKKTKSPDDAKKFAVPRTISKNAPKSLLVRETLQNKLKASMSAKRRKAQEERRKMYEEDNEHLKAGSEEEEEEEEEEVVVRKKKTKKPAEDDYDSDDDEDWKPPEDQEKREDDEMSVNLLNDSFTYDVFNNAKRSGPGSIASNFDSQSQDGSVKVPTMTQMFGAGQSSSNNDDLLDFCSGKFEASSLAEGFPDTLQMLLNEEKPKNSAPKMAKNDEKEAEPASEDVRETSEEPEDVEEDAEDEEEIKKTKPKQKSKRILDSDDEEEGVEQEEEPQKSQDVFAVDSEILEESEVSEVKLTRVVVSGDEDSDSEEDPEDVEDEEEDSDPEDVEEAPEAPEEEPNFDDEDDELAVLKRIEHQEYKKQMKKGTLFDDEASLSGDDVGSDLEDEEGVENAYEAEEGDADDVPDNDTIRRQNFRMLLKQENDKETRALAKLQEKLLADGDLGGVETNRQFRFKLREDVEIQMTDGDEIQKDEDDEEEEESEEKKKERAEMIKYRIEHADELALLEHKTGEDDDDLLFRRAGKLMRKSEKFGGEFSEEGGPKMVLQKPSLLSKTALAVSFQEVLNGAGGGAVAKQMYVQNFGDSEGTRRTSGVKRGPTVSSSPSQKQQQAAKRARSSKLSSLE